MRMLFSNSLRLLLLIGCLLLGLSNNYAASYYWAKVIVTDDGNGSVYVKKTIENSSLENNQMAARNANLLVEFSFSATPNNGYYFSSLVETMPAPGTWNQPADEKLKVQVSNSEGKDNQFVYNLKAIFKDYVYGYDGGCTAEIAEGAAFGKISLDGRTWSTEKVSSSQGTKQTLRQKGDATDSEKDVIRLAYYAKPNDANCFFLGWYIKNANGELISAPENYLNETYTYDFYPESKDSSNPSIVPTLYARFNKKAVYRDQAVAEVVLADADDTYQEMTGEQAELLKLVGAVYVNSSADVKPSSNDYTTPIYTYGTGDIKAISDNASSGNYYYTYHAVPLEGYIFVGWSTDLAGDRGKIKYLKDETPYTHPHFTDVQDNGSAKYPSKLYAVFKKNTYYYYKGAIAGFTENGEIGKITVTSQFYNEAKEDEILKSYSATTTDVQIDDSDKTYNTALNTRTYSYTYTAEYPNEESKALIAFKGWSRSPRGGDIIEDNPYTEEYVTWATTPDGASSPAPLYAVFQSYWFKDPTASAIGAGRVVATYEEGTPSDGDWKNTIPTTDLLNQVAANEEKHNYSVWYYANPNFGAYFKGWSQVADGSQLITDDRKNPYKVDYSVTVTDDTAPFVPARLYAVFESVIQVIQKDRMIYYVDEHGNKNVNDANVIINFNKAATLTATLQDNHDIFRISDKQKVQQNATSLTLDASDGISHFVVSYIGTNPEQDVKAKKTATITLSSDYTNEKGVKGTATYEVEITIDEKPFVTFLPTDGKGSYTIQHTDGRGIDYEMPKEATENIYVSVAQENMSTFELNLTEDVANDGLTFAGWQMIVDGTATYFSYDKKCTHSFKESAFVRPVFLADNRAVFTIDGDPQVRKEYDNKYYDLQQALNDAAAVYAETNIEQVVVFSNEGKQTGTLYQGHYEIPEGVIFLIPGVGPNDSFTMNEVLDEDKYVYRLKHAAKLNTGADIEVALSNDDYYDPGAATYAYRKLYVEGNTTFTVKSGGVLYLYATVNRSGQTYEARPYRYGQMILGENCQIDVENGAELYAFGFITGANSSRVVAKSGAEAHELFQYSDPRGGLSTAHLYLCKNDYKVFPFSQYYVQNIEVPFEIQAGATEYVTTTANMMEMSYVLMASFVIPDGVSTNQSGLFRLGANTSLIKYYDSVKDRQKYILQGSGVGSNVKFGFIEIKIGDLSDKIGDLIDQIIGTGGDALKGIAAAALGLNNVILNSKDYVLPINHNMDVAIQSATVTISNDFACLAGSTFELKSDAVLNLSSNAKMYIYGATENLLPASMMTGSNFGDHTGYFSSTNNPLKPISATPNNSHVTKNQQGKSVLKRQAKDITDAHWIVNGKINIANGAGLYTTMSGAKITSTDAGQIQFATRINETTTYQAKYASASKSDLIEFSLFPPKVWGKVNGINHRVPFNVTSAQLQHANGDYEKTADITSSTTYYYNPSQGKWMKTAPDQNSLIGTQVQVTLPDYNLATDDVDPCSIILTSKLKNVKSATVAWNGGNPNMARNITTDAEGLHIAVDYTPMNMAGEYEGLLNIDNGTYYQRIIVTEDYTPRFSTIGEYNAPQVYLGTNISYEQLLDIVPETNNVAGILSGNYASTWTYDITGTHADEFTLVWGEGEKKLSEAKIVFKPKTAGAKEALLALTCSYKDAADVTHTTCVQVPLTAVVHSLATNNLAFADGVESIFISDDAQPLFTGGNGQKVTIEGKYTSVLEIQNATTQDATVKPVSDQVADLSVTITATQAPDLENGIAGTTITKTITVTKDIVWNWKHLYFGTTNENPVTHHDNITIESIEISENNCDYTETDGTIITVKGGDRHNVVNRLWQPEESTSGYNDHVSIAGWNEGETQVWFTVSYYEGNSTKLITHDYKSEVYRDPRYLPLSVNDNRIYEAVTWAQTGANYSTTDATVTLKPTNDAVAQWTFTFIGIPDLLTFNAQGDSNWQIEESPNGTNWTIAYTWAKIASGVPFELELQPSTRYVRITYGIGDIKGVLSNIAISELTDVRADVEKLYMPMVTTGSTSKNVVFTYVSEDGFNLSTSDVSNAGVFFTDPVVLDGVTDEPYYQIKQVAVSSIARNETSGALSVDDTDLSIPIKVFDMPQAIPIQLASDDEERYYYVTTNTYNTEWDMNNRVVRMHNNVADAAPYVVFHFADKPVPGVISFNFSETAKGTWVIEESEDATKWTPLVANTAQNLKDHFVMQDFQNPGLKSDTDPKPSRYVRVKYVSDYAEIIELSNLAILPTANATVNPSELTVYDTKAEKLQVTANNLTQVTFTLSTGFTLVKASESDVTLDQTALTKLFVKDGGGTISNEIYVKYTGTALATYGTLVISTTQDADGNPLLEGEKTLATVQLTGLKKNLRNEETGINTGTSLKIINFKYKNEGDEGYLRKVNTQHAFAGNTPLFDYVIIYGETKTTDGATSISAPTSTSGSNALTPCYIYKKTKEANSETYTYQLEKVVENANSSTKSWSGAMTVPDNHSLKVYITGFCPYASTGYSKADNGAWYFQGKSGDKIDIYLEDCYLYSRYKTKRGNSFSRSNGETYSDKVVRGSGAVLLFANQDKDNETTMDVTIHTRGTNLLKSHYGCLFESIVGRAFQASAPVQLYMLSKDHYLTSRSTLTFTDEWPTAAAVDSKGQFTTTERTNGFLSLRKQVHNAPSIDMGNKHTVVNFRGGQIELENALNSSDNYESTMAISYRTGVYGPAKFRFELSCGIGTDGTDGTVNFYDGTTTVIPMTVPERYRQYYLMDKDENGKELSTTSCLRSQKNTFVYGGSHCMMRACPLPTDQGGAPTDGVSALGKFEYKDEYSDPSAHPYGLVTPTNFPSSCYLSYYDGKEGYQTNAEGKKCYGLQSISPVNGAINLWLPSLECDDAFDVEPEVNIKNTYWKACMTKIEAKYGIYEGSIGGPTTIEFDTDGKKQAEKVFNLLYCQIDQNISGVITGQNGDDYSAPVLNPAPTENADEKYMSIAPTYVGDEYQNYITNLTDYHVENKVYYIVPAQADIWMAFTAPFDVAKIYIMETRHEQDLHNEVIASKDQWGDDGYRANMLKAQAKHNADFAAFFGVALALESKKPFEDIFADYIGWANWKDNAAKRNKYELVHYYNTYDDGGNLETSNWNEADYYLYKNTGDWELTQQDEEEEKVGNQRFITQWEFVAPPTSGGVLMEQGETYSMLFPYCTGCLSYDENGEIIDRDFWDYWTGKFLIFESIDGANVKDADGNVIGHHIIKGSSFVGSTPSFTDKGDGVDKTMTFKNFAYSDDQLITTLAKSVGQGRAKLNGNPTFAPMGTLNRNVLTLDESLESFGFTVSVEEDIQIIEPTQSFLYTNIVALTSSGQSLLGIGRDGTIRYGGNNSGSQNGTSGHIPTVGGGNDLFITAIEGGINIAVAEPQMVKVMSSTGAVLFAGYITTATDVQLPTHGIYIVSGENEVQKIMH